MNKMYIRLIKRLSNCTQLGNSLKSSEESKVQKSSDTENLGLGPLLVKLKSTALPLFRNYLL